ncbi:hypothetical protein BAZOLSSOX_2003 [uncultured Gammaproteobacteria bacterium]|nr:hypothetical protein BAZOLSSOX_2003 [uncultured Gammaproteobacteria bacterium]
MQRSLKIRQTHAKDTYVSIIKSLSVLKSGKASKASFN